MKTAIHAVAAALLLAVLALPLAAETAGGGAANAAVSSEASGAYYLLTHPRALARFLDLSADQTKTLLGLWQTLRQTAQPLRQARGALCQTLSADLEAATPDPGAVGNATLAVYGNREAILAARKTFDAAFSAILTPSQLAAYDALKQLASPADGEYAVIGYCPRQGS